MSNIAKFIKSLSLIRRFANQPKNTPTSVTPTARQLETAAKPVLRFEDFMPIFATQNNHKIKISFVVIVYRMPEQAKKTLLSLSPQYQRGVNHDDYEIIVVENRSDRLMGEQVARAQAPNIRYYLRDEKLPTPIFAINFGASQARGTHVAIMIDGARMCSPGIVNNMLAAALLAPSMVIAVPGYHLGKELQQIAVQKGYNESVEAALLDSIQWPSDGYRLFEISCLSGTSAGGIFKPIGESNCIAVPRTLYTELGGYDAKFVEVGGGFVNLDFYKRAVEHPETQLVILLGEGTFHQIHGGATTGGENIERERAMKANAAEYRFLRGKLFTPPTKRAIYFGALPDASLKFIRHGADVVINSNNLD